MRDPAQSIIEKQLNIVMEKWLKKRAALYMLIKLVDENYGNISIGTDKVKRVYNDSDDVVRIEYVNGKVTLLADADFETMNSAIIKWQSDNTKIDKLNDM